MSGFRVEQARMIISQVVGLCKHHLAIVTQSTKYSSVSEISLIVDKCILHPRQRKISVRSSERPLRCNMQTEDSNSNAMHMCMHRYQLTTFSLKHMRTTPYNKAQYHVVTCRVEYQL